MRTRFSTISITATSDSIFLSRINGTILRSAEQHPNCSKFHATLSIIKQKCTYASVDLGMNLLNLGWLEQVEIRLKTPSILKSKCPYVESTSWKYDLLVYHEYSGGQCVWYRPHELKIQEPVYWYEMEDDDSIIGKIAFIGDMPTQKSTSVTASNETLIYQIGEDFTEGWLDIIAGWISN